MNVWFGLVVSGSLGSQQPLVKGLVEWLTRVMTGTWSWLAWWFRRNLWKILEAMSVSSKNAFTKTSRIPGIQEVHTHFSWSSLKCLPAKGISRDDFLPCGGALFWDRLIMTDRYIYIYTDICYTLPIINRCFASVFCSILKLQGPKVESQSRYSRGSWNIERWPVCTSNLILFLAGWWFEQVAAPPWKWWWWWWLIMMIVVIIFFSTNSSPCI